MRAKRTIWFQRRALRWYALAAACIALWLGIALCRTLATWHRHPPVRPAATWAPQPQPPAQGSETSLKLITWNIWGLPLATPMREERIAAIAQMVAASGADIVCFQEVFLEADRHTLCAALAKAGLPHWRYFSSAPFGSGLLTLSRYPIEDAVFLRYAKGGNPLAVKYGDWWAGKGAGVVTLKIPDFGKICVINTHLHASYEKHSYTEVRASQLAELMALAKRAGAGQMPVLLLGDLNYKPADPHWQATQHAHKLIRLAGKWSALDYILMPATERFSLTTDKGQPLKGTLQGSDIALSDHTGVQTTVTIKAIAQ